jgi:hypothetical protein
MTYHGYGHAFYEPESSQVLRPGFYGYIDNSGCWQTIVGSTNADKVKEKGFSELEQVVKMRTTQRLWGPKISTSVVRKETTLNTGASG